MIRAAVAIGLAAALTGCAVVVRQPTPADAERAGLPLTDLVEGRSLFVARCSSCHRLPDPGSRNAAEWAKVLPEMMGDAKLSPAEAAQVLAFVTALAEQPSAGLPDAHAQRGQPQHE